MTRRLIQPITVLSRVSAAIRAKASHNLRVSEGVDIYAPRVKWVELSPEKPLG
ncbi:two-component sensor protein histidine protein kinase [Salmonella enterica subsp. enterica serovar Bovismorbificans]|uniref:Two-component sensor protein histidine protein kinase n=1 Tax=Salmonella enterica subsp. enterica serovar Bovismorbificans TaxID=58097 RepID=A0A655CQJ6_SALET|nr:two-component sensor protein histidine protein kinase [Salmonella enterica subsp. enterica serovar Bovismorbificans]